jgi:phage shock protein A
MFRAIGRYFRALGYLLTGKIDAARMTLGTHPDVVRATFDNIVEEKRKRVQQYKDAVGAMIAQEEKKTAELKRQSEEVAKLQKLRDGAAAMARKVVDRHSGDVEAVRKDPEYVKCQAAYMDFGSTLEEKEARCKELEDDIKAIRDSVDGHKVQLQTLLRELEKVKTEKHETVADMITAREEKELADMIAGISEDRSSRELQELRDLRHKAKATARVSREVAGLDTQRAEQEFLEYATASAADKEFDALIGLAREADQDKPEPPERTRIPEK